MRFHRSSQSMRAEPRKTAAFAKSHSVKAFQVTQSSSDVLPSNSLEGLLSLPRSQLWLQHVGRCCDWPCPEHSRAERNPILHHCDTLYALKNPEIQFPVLTMLPAMDSTSARACHVCHVCSDKSPNHWVSRLAFEPR